MKEYNITLDLVANNSVELTGIVNGDTGNVFLFEITQNGIPYSLVGSGGTNNRIRLLISNKNGISSQDTLTDGADIRPIDTAAGKFGVIVHKGMIADGINHGRVEIYEDGDTLITTQPFNFEAVATYIVEKSAEFPSLIMIEERMMEELAQMSSISSVYLDANGHMHIVLANGTDTDIGVMTSLDNSVHYSAETKTDGEKAQARTNIGAAASNHVHGNLQNNGKLAKASALVETDSNMYVTATRKLVVGTTSPSSVDGLEDGDIYIRRATSVNREFEGDVKVDGKLTIGSTDLTEANLIALLALL